MFARHKTVIKNLLPADNLIKYKKKIYSEEQHLVTQELLTTRQQFYRDISTLFQSHCQTILVINSYKFQDN